MNKAIFDIGTNSLKVFVYDNNNPPRLLYKSKIENRLGENLLENDNKIPMQNVVATADHLNSMFEVLQPYDISEVAAFGTEVFRSADNAEDVIAILADLTGLPIKVLSPEQELEYYWHGLVKDFDWDGMIAAIDIGGGSVQFMYGTKEKLLQTHHLKTGALFLRRQCVKSEPPSEADYKAVEEQIAEAIKAINIKFPPHTPFIHGSTSVIDFYTEAGLDLERYNYSLSHPWKLDLKKSRDFYEKLRFLPQVERALFFPSQPGFTDGASIGLANVLLIGEKTGLEFELPSNNSLVHGFL